jgi:hypothetical protein
MTLRTLRCGKGKVAMAGEKGYFGADELKGAEK